MREEIETTDATGLRLCNTISLLMPAYSYNIGCAWTQEVSLPAVEEFTCRLLLALEEVLPGEIKEYFGLSKRECEVLVETLLHNKLAIYTNDGHLAPSPMLLDRTKGNPAIAPSLTKYVERIETPLFELLTVTIMPNSAYSRSRFGLPEIPIPAENRNISNSTIAEAFGRQFKAFLDYSRRPEGETRKTRLYKVSTCDQATLVQIPVDLEIWLLPSPAGDVDVIKKVSEKVSGVRQRPLSMELEAKISDFLNGMKIPTGGLTLAEFCQTFSDTVLERYIDERGLDINRWLVDHAHRKTGYGSSMTRAMIGPIYDNNNRITIRGMLDDMAKDWAEGQSHNALWLSSSVPLWGASGFLLSEFCAKTAELLCEQKNGKGKITAIFSFEDEKEIRQIRRNYHSRIPNGIAFEGYDLQDRVEIFLIPGQLAVVQYHSQPSQESAVTVPIGYVSVDPERVAMIDAFLNSRLAGRGEPHLAWAEGDERDIQNLVDPARLRAISVSPRPLPMSNRPRLTLKKPRQS